jgi:hypothetical protein
VTTVEVIEALSKGCKSEIRIEAVEGYSPHCALSTGTLRINDEVIELADTFFKELSQ